MIRLYVTDTENKESIYFFPNGTTFGELRKELTNINTDVRFAISNTPVINSNVPVTDGYMFKLIHANPLMQNLKDKAKYCPLSSAKVLEVVQDKDFRINSDADFMAYVLESIHHDPIFKQILEVEEVKKHADEIVKITLKKYGKEVGYIIDLLSWEAITPNILNAVVKYTAKNVCDNPSILKLMREKCFRFVYVSCHRYEGEDEDKRYDFCNRVGGAVIDKLRPALLDNGIRVSTFMTERWSIKK